MEITSEDAEELCNYADTILNICAASAKCASLIASWKIRLQRQIQLSLPSPILEKMKKRPAGRFHQPNWIVKAPIQFLTGTAAGLRGQFGSS